MSGTIHATCVAIDRRGVLLTGRSGSGKSDLALRLIDRGAMLVSDDYTALTADSGRLIAAPPATIAGRIEVRGLGIVPMPHVGDVPVALLVALDEPVERLPEDECREVAGVMLPVLRIAAPDASAALKVEMALALLGVAGKIHD